MLLNQPPQQNFRETPTKEFGEGYFAALVTKSLRITNIFFSFFRIDIKNIHKTE